jgi:hypothetical protein
MIEQQSNKQQSWKLLMCGTVWCVYCLGVKSGGSGTNTYREGLSTEVMIEQPTEQQNRCCVWNSVVCVWFGCESELEEFLETPTEEESGSSARGMIESNRATEQQVGVVCETVWCVYCLGVRAVGEVQSTQRYGAQRGMIEQQSNRQLGSRCCVWSSVVCVLGVRWWAVQSTHRGCKAEGMIE